MIWVSADCKSIASYSATSLSPETGISATDAPSSLTVEGSRSAPEIEFTGSRDQRQTLYSPPLADSFGNQVFQAQIELLDRI